MVSAFLERLARMPYRSTWRSDPRYAAAFLRNQAAHPELILDERDLYLAGFIESDGHGWLSFAASNLDALHDALPRLVPELLARLAAQGVTPLQLPVPTPELAEAFTPFGFCLGEVTSYYELSQPFPALRQPDPAIRPMTVDDLDAVVEINRKCFPPARHFDREVMRQIFDRMASRYVYELGGKVIGFQWNELKEGDGLLEGLAVDPEAQAGGIGTALLHNALRYFQDQGARVIKLFTYPDSAAAKLYERQGFVCRSLCYELLLEPEVEQAQPGTAALQA